MTAITYIPTADDALSFVGSLEDPGTWRYSRVTHWHLWRDETGTNARDRFDNERLRSLIMNPAGVATDPREALRWLVSHQRNAVSGASAPARAAAERGWRSREDWQERTLVSWHSLSQGWRVPSGFGIQVRDGWSVMIYADPMTPGDCSRKHQVTDPVLPRSGDGAP